MEYHELTIIEANQLKEMIVSCITGSISEVSLTINSTGSIIKLTSDGSSKISIGILEAAEREACKQAMRMPIDKTN